MRALQPGCGTYAAAVAFAGHAHQHILFCKLYMPQSRGTVKGPHQQNKRGCVYCGQPAPSAGAVRQMHCLDVF